MALPGEIYTQTATFTWTRGEFSTGSTTRLYESTTIGGTGSQVASVASSVTSKTISKEIDSAAAQFTRYYRVRHALSNGTLGSLVGPVTLVWGGGAL